MKDFYNYKGQYEGLFTDQVFSNKKDTQYLSETEKKSISLIPDEALLTIRKFDAGNSKIQTSHAGYGELAVLVPIWSPHIEQTLLYALTSGTAYTIEKGNIYIWYKPFKGFEGSGFYKLKRFVFLENGRYVKYFLDGNEKLPNPS